ncbi:MAG: hypothetical protein PHD05_00090 [Sphaerochaetaceae bacterium]|nr:hypothetical protein [Sphaerochaetaceae bacterium]
MIFDWKNMTSPDHMYKLLSVITSTDICEVIQDPEHKQSELITNKRNYIETPLKIYEVIPGKMSINSDRTVFLYNDLVLNINNYPKILKFINEYCPHIQKFINDHNIQNINFNNKIKIFNYDTLNRVSQYINIYLDLADYIDKTNCNNNFHYIIIPALSKMFYSVETKLPQKFKLINNVDYLIKVGQKFENVFDNIEKDKNYLSQCQEKLFITNYSNDVKFLDNLIISNSDFSLLYLKNIDLILLITITQLLEVDNA